MDDIKKSKPSMKDRPVASSKWFGNVMRSLGYTSTKLVEQLIPSSSEFITGNVEYTKELYDDIRNIRTSQNQMKTAISSSPYVKNAKQGFKNAIEDIKSGNIYNKERLDKVYEDDFSLDGFDLDTSFDDGLGHTDIDTTLEDTSSEDEEKAPPVPIVNVKNIQPPITKNNPMVRMIQKSTEATYDSARMISDTNVAIHTDSLAHSKRSSIRSLEGLSSINENLSLLVNFQSESMVKYIGASIKYYDDNLSVLNETLNEIRKGNSMLNQPDNKPRKEDPSNDVFFSGGGLNLKGYVGMVKHNAKKEWENNSILSSVKMMFDMTDDKMLEEMAANPLGTVAMKVTKMLIPSFLQASMKSMDKTFSSFFPAMLMKINRLKTGNPIMDIIPNILGFKSDFKQTVDITKYNKGPMPYNGLANKSIVEVIPGYLRKILSALTGDRELSYDFNKAHFMTAKDMTAEFNKTADNRIKSSYSDAIDHIKEKSNAFVFEDKTQREAFDKGIEKFFLNLTKRTDFVDPSILRDKNGSAVNEFNSVYDFEENPLMAKLFRQLFFSMDEGTQARTLTRDVIDARRAGNDFYHQAEENPEKFNAGTIFNGLKTDTHIDKKGKIIKGKGGLLNRVDSFGLDELDYLRRIERIMLEGVKVIPLTSFAPKKKKGGGHSAEVKEILKNQKSRLDSNIDTEDRQKKAKVDEESKKFLNLSDKDKENMAKQGRVAIGPNGLAQDVSENDISKVISNYSDLNTPKKDNTSLFEFIAKFFKGDKQDKINLIREKVDSLLKKPAEILDSVVRRIDTTMYKLMFSGSRGDEDTSFFTKTIAIVKQKFEDIGNWFSMKVIDPLKENLFGKEGIFTKLKNSDFNKNMKKKFNNVMDFVFGKADSAGTRSGGFMSETANSFADMWDSVKYYFNGSEYTNRAGIKFPKNEKSVFGEMKVMFKSFKDNTKAYLFGDKTNEDPDKHKGFLGGMLSDIMDGFSNFKTVIFGPKFANKKDGETTLKELRETIKKRAPKAVAWGMVGGGVGLVNMGLLGSMFLPGGPVGGAIVGTTLGYLSQSDKFKDWLFGAKDLDGNRVGGVITKSTMMFLQKNRIPIIGGATVGAIKGIGTSMGLLPSFFLPGGPVAGALMGIGAAMFIRSETFQKFLFGPKGEDGKRTGGMLQKLYGKTKEGKKYFGNVGAGIIGGAGLGWATSHMGLMGAMLIPGGPIGGAILGAAAGIALTSDKWKKAIFGEWDEKTGLRKGGMLGQFTNWFKLEVREPLKNELKKINLGIKEWFTKSIANPFMDAIEPMKQSFKIMTENLQKFFVDGWESFKTKIGDVFEKHVGKPFGKFMEDRVMKPLKSFLHNIVYGVGKVFGAVLSSPFKALSMVTTSMRENHEKRGLEKHVEDGWNNIRDSKGRKERGERMGFFRTKDADGNVVGKGFLGQLKDMYLDKDKRNEARYGEHGASYAKAEDERIAKRNAEQDAEFAKRRKDIEEGERQLSKRQKVAKKNDYDNFDKKGNNISRIYGFDINNILSTKGDAKETTGRFRKIEEFMGSSLARMLGKKDEEEVDVFNLTRAEKKRLSKAIKSGLKGKNVNDFLTRIYAKESKKEETDDAIAKPESNKSEKGTDDVKNAISDLGDSVSKSIKDESPKSEIKESNTILGSIRGMAEKIYDVLKDMDKSNHKDRFKDEIFGKKAFNTPNLKNKITPKKVYKSTTLKSLSEKHEKRHPHASGIDEVPYDNYPADLHQGEMVIPAKQANFIRRIFGVKQATESQVQGPINDSNKLVNAINTLESSNNKGPSSEEKNTILSRIASDVRIIAQEVKGQLDGVGSNVFKIRKMIQKQSGVLDGDITGSANRDRIGFFGKLRRMMFKPLEFIKDGLVKAVTFVTDKIAAVGTAIVKTTKAILSIPINIAKMIGKIGIEVGKVVKDTFLGIIKLPGKILDIMVSGVKGAVEVLKMVGPAVAETLKGAASLFAGTLKMFGSTLAGFGKGLGSIIAGFGKGVGNVFTELGKGVGSFIATTSTMVVQLTGTVGKTLISGLSKSVGIVTDIVTESTKMAVDFSLSMTKTAIQFTTDSVKMVSEKLLTIGDSLIQMVTSPLKWFAKGLGTLFGFKQEVVVSGGHLDSIGMIGIDSRLSKPKPEKETTSSKKSDSKDPSVKPSDKDKPFKSPESKPMRVVIVSGEKPIVVTMDHCPCEESLKKLFPIPVTISAGNGGGSVSATSTSRIGFLGGDSPTSSMSSPGSSIGFINHSPSASVSPIAQLGGSGAPNIADTITNSLTGAFKNFDAYNDKQEANKQHVKEFKDKIASKQKDVSKKNAAYQIKMLDEKADKKFTRDSTERQLDLLSQIAKSSREHKDGWFKVFGPKGFLTMAAMVALPFLKQIFEFLMGWKNNDSRTDADGSTITNSDLGEHLTKGAATAVKTVVNKKIIPGKKAVVVETKKVGQVVKDGIKFVEEKAVPKVAAVVNKVKDSKVGQAVTKAVTKTAESKPAQVIKNVTVKGADAAVNAANIALTKAQEAAQFLMDSVSKMFGNESIKSKIGKDVAEKTGADLVGSLKKIFTKDFLAKFGAKLRNSVAAKVAAGGAKLAAGAFTLGTSELVWGAWNVTTGFAEASHLFKINDDQVDFRMRTISSVIKAIIGFGWNFVIGILNDICVEFTGIDFIQKMANTMYSYMSSSEDYNKLLSAQDAFKGEVDAYNQQNGTNLSVDAYNDKVNKTVGQKIVDSVKSGWNATKKGASWVADKTMQGVNWVKEKGSQAINWAGEKISAGWNKAKEIGSEAWTGMKKFGSEAWDGAKKVGGAIKNGAVKAFDTAKEYGSKAWNAAKEYGKTTGVYKVYKGFSDDEEVKKNFNVKGDGKVTTGMRVSSAIGNLGQDLTFGMIDSKKITKSVMEIGLKTQKFFTDIGEGLDKHIVQPVKGWWNDTTKLLKDNFNNALTDAKNKWETIKTNLGKAWDDVKTTVEGVITPIVDGAKSAWEYIKDKVSSGWTQVKDFISGIVTPIVDATTSAWNFIKDGVANSWDRLKTIVSDTVEKAVNFTSEKWNALKDLVKDGWDKTTGFVKDVSNKVVNFTKSIWDPIATKISNAWTNVKNSITGIVDGIVTTTSDIWTKTKEGIAKKWTEFTDGFSKKIDDVKNFFTGWIDKIKEKLGIGADQPLPETPMTDDYLKQQGFAKGFGNIKKPKKQDDQIISGFGSINNNFNNITNNNFAGNRETTQTKNVTNRQSNSKTVNVLNRINDDVNKVTRTPDTTPKAKNDIEFNSTTNVEPKVKPFEPSRPGIKSLYKMSDSLNKPAEDCADGSCETTPGGFGDSDVPFYSQTDSKWANKTFAKSSDGNMTVAKAGCGPTSAAMLFSSVTGQNITPEQTLEYAQDKGYTNPEIGTDNRFFKDFGSQLGVNITREGNDPKQLTNNLMSNRPVILQGRGGRPFTDSGHYIVATGMTRDGKVKVNDPLSKTGGKEYSINTLMKNTSSSFVPTSPGFGNNRMGKLINDTDNTFEAAFGNADSARVFAGWKITSNYGYRIHPIDKVRKMHRGIDLVKPAGSAITSFTNGTVVFAGTGGSGSGYSGYGEVVAVKDERGYTHVYAHLLQGSITVRVGQKITVGTKVGVIGSTGKSTGLHLHYEVRKGGFGTDVNPTDYLLSYKANKDFVASSVIPDAGASSGATDYAEDTSTMGLMNKMVENFTLYTDNVLSGTNKKLTWGKPGSAQSSSFDSGSSYSGTSLDSFVPKTPQDKILKKVAQMTIQRETNGNYFYGRNDHTGGGQTISPSIGIAQWRGPDARKIMQQMAQLAPNDPDAKYFANSVNWDDRTPWSSAQQARLESYFKRNSTVTKKVQDGYLLNHIRNVNMAPVYKYGVDKGKIKDPRSIALLSEFAQTGPANVSKFLSQYTPSGGNEFDNFYKQMRSDKSYWGRHIGTYNSRFAADYGELKGWTPGMGVVEGGMGNTNTKFAPNKKQEKLYTKPDTKVTGGMGGGDDKQSSVKITKNIDTSMPETGYGKTDTKFAPRKKREDVYTKPDFTKTFEITPKDKPTSDVRIVKHIEPRVEKQVMETHRNNEYSSERASANSNINTELLTEALKVLNSIAKNTSDTAANTKKIVLPSGQQVHVNTQSNPSVTNVSVNGGNKTIVSQQQSNGSKDIATKKAVSEYSIADSIAKGRRK